ncbi:YdcF family protein [Gordonia sp. TBRC 11910]|uniref:YdcF family protein n=1 Tax=Gordonia asplenii TaxID=2725283 RepID=A0A848KSN0_9ACTN|nr:YdcF family protein [Gordonia asplenii]
MNRGRRFKVVAVGTVVAAAVGGAAVGALPVAQSTSITHTADSIDAGKLYNSAQKKFEAGDVTGGLTDLASAVKVAGNDADILALQAIWSDQVDDTTARNTALTKLASTNATAAATARNIIDGVTAAAALVPDARPKNVVGQTAIVILGGGVAGGLSAPELVNRLTVGAEQARIAASAPIIVSGGAPKGSAAAASGMRKWLIGKGISASRIATDDASTSTVTSAQNTAAILKLRGVSDAVLVTSPNQLRSAAADFAGAGLKVAAAVTTSTDLSKYATPLTKDQQKGIRLESTRAAKIPASKTEGLLLPGSLPDPGPGLITDIGGKMIEGLFTGSKG